MEWFIGIAALVVGLLLGLIIQYSRSSRQLTSLREVNAGLDKEKTVLTEKAGSVVQERDRLEGLLDLERKRAEELSKQLAGMEADQRNLLQKLDTQKTELEQIQQKLTTEFENIAHKVLKVNSQEFTSTNQRNIGDILAPLKEKIDRFEKKVEETYEKGLKDQTDMRAELKKLYDLNHRISEEASNLTRALKSDTKKMGNWGELILDRILEQSGLVKGHEYETQYTDRNDQGDLVRPDVVVHLPDHKHLVIDSKVSLIAYDAFVNSDDDAERARHLKAHLDSVREHVRSLGEKNYPSASSLDTPDFVLLFMPLESAFSLAIQGDSDLFSYAWDRKIVIVSPTTLLATLMTVQSIWKHEKQTRNALEIASHGKSLFEKFHAFVTDLERIGNQIGSLQNTYQEAYKKLSTGKGNLLRQAEKLKELGIKTEKSLADRLLIEEGNEEESSS